MIAQTIPAIPAKLGWYVDQDPPGDKEPGIPFIERWIFAPVDPQQPVQQSFLFVFTYPAGTHLNLVLATGSNHEPEITCVIIGQQVACVANVISAQNNIEVTVVADDLQTSYLVSVMGFYGSGALALTDRIVMRTNRVYLPGIQN